MALLAVEVSGAKNSPWGWSHLFKSSRITPGSTLTHLSALFNSSIWVKWGEISTIIPLPTTCPANEVPAALGIRDSC